MAHERENLETLMNAQVEGIMVSLSRTTREFQHFEKVRQRDIPLVFFDRILAGHHVNAVVIDDRAGGYQATQHLLEDLVSTAPPKNRELEAAKARARSANRFATA